MFKPVFIFTVLFLMSYSVNADTIARLQSNYSASETATRFEEILKSKGLTLFARINHQENAAGIDIDMRPSELFVFGNPKVGTPLMQCSQQVAIDLPQKMLVSEDAQGLVWLSYNKPSYLKERHQIQGCDELLTKITGVLQNLAEAAVK